jgi:hypothetical protein
LAGHESSDVLSAYLMFHRFARALKIANRDSGFAQIFGAALLLVIVGTLTYSITRTARSSTLSTLRLRL